MANLGYRGTQTFYGHLLLFCGQGFGACEEGPRLSCLTASAGNRKTACQLGMQAPRGDSRRTPDALAASRHWALAAGTGHPLVARKLAGLYRDEGSGLVLDSERTGHCAQRTFVLDL